MKKNCVLIVEDDPDVRRSLALLLGVEFEVLLAEDAIMALTMVRNRTPDVVVLDLGLPGGDGLEVLTRLQRFQEVAVPTIVVTGRDGDAVASEAIARGAARVFHKPADPAELRAAVRSLVPEQSARRRVLVVEDDADIREALSIRLRAANYAVTCAGDGATAVMSACTNHPDVILLDLGLPCGDGLSVLKRLRSLSGTAATPVVVLSGRNAAAAGKEAMAAGANLYLQKPATHLDILEALRSVS